MTLRTWKRRRLENKTDYKLRLGLLKSSLSRIVVRKTNKYIILQVVESKEAQDKVVFGLTSKDLLEYGWDEKFAGSLKSVPASYLTGYLAGKKIKKGDFILDMGMLIKQKGGRVFAVVAGLVDSGINLRANSEVFPKKEKIIGESLRPEVKAIIEKVKEKIDSKK